MPTDKLSLLSKLLRNMYLLWFIALGIIVLGPLLGSGYLLLLDAPAGPDQIWPSFLALPSEGISPAIPSLTVERLLSFMGTQLPNKLLVLAVPAIGGIGLHRFLVKSVGTSVAAGVVAATFFGINPWVYDRMVSGQLFLVVAYSLLPWALPSLGNIADRCPTADIAKGLGWSALIAAVDIHVGGMATLLLVSAIAFSSSTILRKLTTIAVCLLVLVATNLFWLLPSLLVQEASRLGGGDLIAYAPRPRSARILPFVLTLHGFWRLEFDSPIRIYPARFFATFLPLVLLSVYGLLRAITAKAWVRASGALAGCCAIAVVLGMGRSFPPTAPLAEWLFNNLPGYGIFREPQKWIGLLALGYAVFMGIGLDGIATRLDRVRSGAGNLVVVGTVLPLVATSVMLWGFGGRVHLSEFPDGWERVDSVTEGQDGAVLFLPWNHYQPVPFADLRTIANPAPDYFSAPVLISDDPQLLVREETSPPDPRDSYISELLRKRGRLTEFGHLVAPLGVRYVALAHVADFRAYGFLDRQLDLRTLFSTDDMTLYENLAFSMSPYALKQASSLADLGELLRSSGGQESAVSELQVFAPSAVNKPLPGPGFAEALPLWDRIHPLDAALVGTDKSCLDGWRLGPEEPVCHLGAVAAFESPGTDVHLWRPGAALQVIAYLVSLLAVVALLIAVRWAARTNEKTPRTEWGSSPTSDGR